jgi:hypothetical protein
MYSKPGHSLPLKILKNIRSRICPMKQLIMHGGKISNHMVLVAVVIKII